MEELSYTSTHPLGHTGPVTGSLYLKKKKGEEKRREEKKKQKKKKKPYHCLFRFNVSRYTKPHAVATASVFLLLTADWFALWIIHKPRIICIQTLLHYAEQRQTRNTKNAFPEAAEQ